MKKSILVCFHKYTPFGGEYYQPLYDYFIGQMKEYRDEFDRLYLIDSNWGIENPPNFAQVIKVNPSLRYYDAYKEVLPQIGEDLVLLLDNDMLVYRWGVIKSVFERLKDYDVVSIYDTCGEFKTDKLNGKNKFCPYLFAAAKNLLMKYREVDWGSKMPAHETLGKLTEVMLQDGVKPYELEEDKSNILFNGHQDGEKGKDLGYYHVRSGSVPALLLAWLKEGRFTAYFDYLHNQPLTEYLRQAAWFWWMLWTIRNEKVMRDFTGVLRDAGLQEKEWYQYFKKFILYHNLPYAENFVRVN